jgi:hypothetical protein
VSGGKQQEKGKSEKENKEETILWNMKHKTRIGRARKTREKKNPEICPMKGVLLSDASARLDRRHTFQQKKKEAKAVLERRGPGKFVHNGPALASVI